MYLDKKTWKKLLKKFLVFIEKNIANGHLGTSTIAHIAIGQFHINTHKHTHTHILIQTHTHREREREGGDI